MKMVQSPCLLDPVPIYITQPGARRLDPASTQAPSGWMRWVDRLDGWVAGCWIRLESSTQPHDAVPGWPERSCVPRGWIQSADPASSIQDPAKLPGFGIGRNAPNVQRTRSQLNRALLKTGQDIYGADLTSRRGPRRTARRPNTKVSDLCNLRVLPAGW